MGKMSKRKGAAGEREAAEKLNDVLGMTEQAVDHRLRNAMRKWPSLRALFALKAAKQERRRGICRTAGGAS